MTADPATLLNQYRAMFALARTEGLPLLEDSRSDFTRVVWRIEDRLKAGTATEKDVEELRGIAALFRAQKEQDTNDKA